MKLDWRSRLEQDKALADMVLFPRPKGDRPWEVEFDIPTTEEIRDAWVWTLPGERIDRVLGPEWRLRRTVIPYLHRFEPSPTDMSVLNVVRLTDHEVRCALARCLPGSLAGIALEPDDENDLAVFGVATYTVPRRKLAVVPFRGGSIALYSGTPPASPEEPVSPQREVMRVEAPPKCEPIVCTVEVDTRELCDGCWYLEEQSEDGLCGARFYQCARQREFLCLASETPEALPGCGGPHFPEDDNDDPDD